MKSHPYLASAVSNRRFLFIYGVPGTGKTRLAIHTARLASTLGYEAVVIETEAVSSIVSRLYEGYVDKASTFDELVNKVTLHGVIGRYLVVDSVNSFYPSEPSSSRRKMLAFMASMLRKVGGLAIGQARVLNNTITSPGLDIISLYADIIGVTEKIGSDKFKVEILKPERRLMVFRIIEGDIEWL